MRSSLVAGAAAGALILSSIQVPLATAQSSELQNETQTSETQSSVPDSVKPIELLKKEVGGYVRMSSGLVQADPDAFTDGFKQAAEVLVPAFLGTIALGSVIELVMRGLRMVNQR